MYISCTLSFSLPPSLFLQKKYDTYRDFCSVKDKNKKWGENCHVKQIQLHFRYGVSKDMFNMTKTLNIFNSILGVEWGTLNSIDVLTPCFTPR